MNHSETERLGPLEIPDEFADSHPKAAFYLRDPPLRLSGRLRGRVARDRRCGLLIRKLAATTMTVVAAPSRVVSIWVRPMVFPSAFWVIPTRSRASASVNAYVACAFLTGNDVKRAGIVIEIVHCTLNFAVPAHFVVLGNGLLPSRTLCCAPIAPKRKFDKPSLDIYLTTHLKT